MAGDMDAVNERLAGLVNLLHVVGIDGVNPDSLVQEQQRMAVHGPAATMDRAEPSRGAPASGSDAQILEIIRKLQQAEADSPEILAALRSPELRALASLAAQKQQSTAAPPASPPPKKASPNLDDVMDDDDNYPKIGPGYSDDISVVSDLTTPTVMTKQNVHDEELYMDVNGGPGALPPMLIGTAGGGAQQPARPTNIFGGSGGPHLHHPAKPNHLAGGGKTRNMVGQVRPGAARKAIAKSGGAAAQRRLNYQQAMQKLQTTDFPGSPPPAGGGGAASAAAGGSRGAPGVAAAPEATPPEKSYMENFSPKRPKEYFSPTSPTTSQDPMEFPSMAGEGSGSGSGTGGVSKKKTKSKSLSSRAKGKKTALASQEASDFDFEGTDPIRAPPTPNGSVGVSGGKKKSGGSRGGHDVDWGVTDSNGWPAFDGGKKDVFVDNDGFFPTDAFAATGNDNGFRGQPSSGRKVVAAHDDGHTPLSSRKISKVKKDDSKRDKEKLGKKKSRRASLSM